VSWIKLDDRFPDHEKTIAAGPEAAWLFIEALCWSSRHEADGKIPESVLHHLVSNGEELAERLVAAGFVRRTKSGFSIVNYTKRQRTRAEIEDERAKGRGRVAAHRSRRRNAVTKPDVMACNEKVRATDTEAEADTDLSIPHPSSNGTAARNPAAEDRTDQLARTVLERIADSRLAKAKGVKNPTRYRARVLGELPVELDMPKLHRLIEEHPGAPIDSLAGAILGEPNTLHLHRAKAST
jgi:hypothetical protein